MLLRERVAAKLAMRVGIREVTNHAVASHSIVFRIVHVCFRIVEGSLAHGAWVPGILGVRVPGIPGPGALESRGPEPWDPGAWVPGTPGARTPGALGPRIPRR